jgi:surface protein
MFQLCSNITELDLSSWNMANVQSNSGMFSGCSNLITLRLPDLPHIGSHMFYNCSSLDRLHLSSIVAPVDDPNPTNPTEPFENIKMNGTLYVPNGSTGYDSSPWTTLKNTYGWNFLGAIEWTMNSLFWMESTATTPTNQTAILSDRAIYKSSEELGVLEVSFDVDWLTYVGQY